MSDTKTPELAVVTADLFNQFSKQYNDELNFTLKQLANTVEAAEVEFRNENFTELESMSEDQVSDMFARYLPIYLEEIHQALVQVNAENMSDPKDLKELRIRRYSRVATIMSMMYQTPINTKTFCIDNVTFDAYQAAYQQAQDAQLKAAQSTVTEALDEAMGVNPVESNGATE